MHSGQILNWNTEKGFGFIQPDAGGKHVFAHINDYSQRHKPPVKGLAVNYALSEDSKGRPCAINVIPIKSHKKSGIHIKQKNFAAILAIVFSLFLAVLYFSKIIPVFIVGIYVVMSLLTFYCMRTIKKQRGGMLGVHRKVLYTCFLYWAAGPGLYWRRRLFGIKVKNCLLKSFSG